MARPGAVIRPASRAHVRVLVLDDSAVGGQVWAAQLRRIGVEPVVVSTMEAALREISARPVHAIITDLFIDQKWRGTNTAEELRRVAPLSTPIIATSVRPMDPAIDIDRLARLGVQFYPMGLASGADLGEVVKALLLPQDLPAEPEINRVGAIAAACVMALASALAAKALGLEMPLLSAILSAFR